MIKCLVHYEKCDNRVFARFTFTPEDGKPLIAGALILMPNVYDTLISAMGDGIDVTETKVDYFLESRKYHGENDTDE